MTLTWREKGGSSKDFWLYEQFSWGSFEWGGGLSLGTSRGNPWKLPSCWFQPIWNIWVKLNHFPKHRGENQTKNWNHHPSTTIHLHCLIPSSLGNFMIQRCDPSVHQFSSRELRTNFEELSYITWMIYNRRKKDARRCLVWLGKMCFWFGPRRSTTCRVQNFAADMSEMGICWTRWNDEEKIRVENVYLWKGNLLKVWWLNSLIQNSPRLEVSFSQKFSTWLDFYDREQDVPKECTKLGKNNVILGRLDICRSTEQPFLGKSITTDVTIHFISIRKKKEHALWHT